jgi:hypothetical protein
VQIRRPAWIPSPNRDHPDFLYVTAVCRGAPGLGEGRTCALGDANMQIARELGRADVAVRGDFIQDEWSERGYRDGNQVFDVWLLVAYPRQEVRKAKTRVNGRVLVGIACLAGQEPCEYTYAPWIEQAVSRGGLAPAVERLPPQAVSEMLARPDLAVSSASQSDAAGVLLVLLESRFVTQNNDEFYSEGRGTIKLIDALDGKVLFAFDTGWLKAGHFSMRDSLWRAVKNASDVLSARLAAGVRR